MNGNDTCGTALQSELTLIGLRQTTVWSTSTIAFQRAGTDSSAPPEFASNPRYLLCNVYAHTRRFHAAVVTGNDVTQFVSESALTSQLKFKIRSIMRQ